ncbi:unnamed protein product [Spodoptera exigua]|nr:unnamed protein product [Spodoptera exigua]
MNTLHRRCCRRRRAHSPKCGAALSCGGEAHESMSTRVDRHVKVLPELGLLNLPDHWNETSRQTQARQAIDAERHAAQRAAETSQQSQARQIIDAERHADQRAAETSQHTQARQILDAEHQASYIAAETSEETRRRRLINAERQAERRRTFAMNTWEIEWLINADNEALKWKEETLGMCCSGGKVSVPTLGDPEKQRQKKGQQ